MNKETENITKTNKRPASFNQKDAGSVKFNTQKINAQKAIQAPKQAVSKIVFSRALILLLMIGLQIAAFPIINVYLARYVPYAMEVMTVLGTICVIIVINKDEPAEFKLTWCVILCILPILGVLLYIFVQSNWGMIGLKHKVSKGIKATQGKIFTSKGTKKALEEESWEIKRFAHYMDNYCGFPIYHNTKTTYFPIGEEYIADLVEELKKAQRYIFMEYFIINRGEVWDSVLEVLKEKAAAGVEVRVMYDGLCSLSNLPYSYPKEMAKFGIKAKMFAPIVPFFSTNQNNRDHRKIVVIDGKVAYTGGVNLADEYANLIDRFGHWKDGGIKLEGRAVLSFLMMFTQMWNVYGKEDLDYDKYLLEHVDRPNKEHDGFVIPYADTPTLQKEIGKTVYSDMFAQSNHYIHSMTPYFVIDREFLTIMKYAAHRGVEVKLIVPHIPDKKIPFWIARTFYPQMISAGIKIYEYTPGFVHSKVMVSDGIVASCGSINVDYRSFYHHFECGVYLYKSSAVMEIEEDFQETLTKCQEVTIDYYKSLPAYQRAIGHIFKLLAPMI
ncbi:MAG: cardiolipin synthase [Lachnospiraceae bacterium]|nr:cardiolipin synthase [Lachnospiraceae bacterium]